MRVLMGKEEVERSKCAKCLGVMLDDGTSATSEEKVLYRISQTEEVKECATIQNKEATIQRSGTAPP